MKCCSRSSRNRVWTRCRRGWRMGHVRDPSPPTQVCDMCLLLYLVMKFFFIFKTRIAERRETPRTTSECWFFRCCPFCFVSFFGCFKRSCRNCDRFSCFVFSDNFSFVRSVVLLIYFWNKILLLKLIYDKTTFTSGKQVSALFSLKLLQKIYANYNNDW